MTASAGSHLGRYELVRPLGQGGMGEVWEAVLHGPEGFRKQVALKLLREGPKGDENARTALLQEARLGALLCHPNVVGTWELGRVDRRWFVAMELVRGVSAADLARFGTLDAPAALDLALQVCAGLAHIHGLQIEGHPRGLVHRDIKPANLLVDRTGLVKVADLGIARLQGGLDGEAIGTPGYMAPEQTRGQSVPASDLFSLAVVVHRLITGQLPFGRGLRALARVHQVEAMIDRGLLEPVREVAPGLDDVLRRCMHADPGRRPRDAGEVADALRAVPLPPGRGLAEVLQERLGDLRSAEMVGTSGRRVLDPSAETVVLTESPPDNLPARPYALVGRQTEIDTAMDALSDHPILTLRGPPGVGKTRLALEIAAGLQAAFPGGTWWIRCAEARTVQGLCAAVAEALDRKLRTERPVQELAEVLADLPATLLVLDNVESIAAPAATALDAWGTAAPDARFLVTSRVPLRAPREHVQPVRPLPLDHAVQLFEALAEHPIPDDQREALAELVERLDRLPLAIDLAAARASVLSPAQLLQRIDERFRLLTRRTGGDSRHGSLFAALEASWALLEPWEQQAYAQLSVFAGGFDMESAEAVLALGPDAPWALDVLTALLDHSLVQHERATQRFHMLPTVQDHAASHLTGEARERAEQRHTELCMRITDGPGQRAELWTRERDNLTVALRRAIDRSDGPTAAHIGRVMIGLLHHRGPMPAGLELATEVLALDLGDRRADILRARGSLLRSTHRFQDARQDLEDSLRLARARGDTEDEAHALIDLGNVVRESGESLDEARALLEEGRAVAGDAHPIARARVLSDLGIVHRLQGDLDEAARLQRESLDLSRSLGRQFLRCTVLNNLAIVLCQTGDIDEARELYEQSIRLARALGADALQINPLSNLGILESERGNLRRAETLHRRAVRLWRRAGSPMGAAAQRCNVAAVMLSLGKLEPARLQLDAAHETMSRYPPSPHHSLIPGNRSMLRRLEGDPVGAEPLLSEARELERAHGDAATLCLLEGSLADLHRVQGRPREGLVRVSAALRQVEELGDIDLTLELSLVRALCRLDLGDIDDAETELRALLTASSLPAPRTARAKAGLAIVHAKRGQLDAARELLDDVEQLRSDLGCLPPSLVGIEQQRAREAVAAAEG